MRIYPPHQDKVEGKPLHFRDVEDEETLKKMISNGWTHDKAVSLGLKEAGEPIIPVEKEDGMQERIKEGREEEVEKPAKRRGRPKKAE